MRGFARFLAAMIALLGGMVIVFAVIASLGRLVGIEPDGEGCCPGASRRGADAVVVGQVTSGSDDVLTLDVASVDRGDVGDEVIVRSYGVRVSPFREYRFWLFRGRRVFRITDQVNPEPLRFAFPAGVDALGSLPLLTRMAIASVPPLLASLWVLLRTRTGARRGVPGKLWDATGPRPGRARRPCTHERALGRTDHGHGGGSGRGVGHGQHGSAGPDPRPWSAHPVWSWQGS